MDLVLPSIVVSTVVVQGIGISEGYGCSNLLLIDGFVFPVPSLVYGIVWW